MKIDTWTQFWALVIAVFFGCIEAVRDFLMPIKYVLLGCVICVFVDLVLGTAESSKRGIEIRCSRAMRRTFVKLGIYFCMCLLASFFQLILSDAKVTFPALSLLLSMGICLFELESIINHWLILHDRKPIDFKHFFTIFLKGKNKILGELSEEYEKQQKDKNKDEDTIKKE